MSPDPTPQELREGYAPDPPAHQFNLAAAERTARLGDKAAVVAWLRAACDEILRLRAQETPRA